MRMTISQFAELIESRPAKCRPTSPLHSEGYDISGLESVAVVVGYELHVPNDSPEGRKLIVEYQKHRTNRASKLSEMIGGESVFKFLALVDNISILMPGDHDFASVAGLIESGKTYVPSEGRTGEEDEPREEDEDPDEDNAIRILLLAKIVLGLGLKASDVIINTDQLCSEENGYHRFERALVGTKLRLDTEASKTIKEIKEISEKLAPMGKKLGEKEPTIFLSGNGVEGTCF